MDVSGAVKETHELRRARQLLIERQQLLSIGIKSPPTAAIPDLTDQECAILSQQFSGYTYEAIRDAFGKRY
jgi:hypothetical protein